MLAMPWKAMPWDAGLAILGVYRILRARKGRRPGGIRRTGTCVAGASTTRRRRVDAPPRSVILQKSVPKSRSNLERLLEAKMLQKASKNDPQNFQKIIEIAMRFSIEFLIRFCIEFCLFP